MKSAHPNAAIRSAARRMLDRLGTMRAVERETGVQSATLRSIIRDDDYRPKPETYQRLGVPVPDDAYAGDRIEAAVARMVDAGERLTIREVARQARANFGTVVNYFEDYGLPYAGRRDAKPRGQEPPCPTAIFFAAHRVKRATLEATKDKRRRPAPPSSVGYRPRVYRYTGEMLL